MSTTSVTRRRPPVVGWHLVGQALVREFTFRDFDHAEMHPFRRLDAKPPKHLLRPWILFQIDAVVRHTVADRKVAQPVRVRRVARAADSKASA